MRMDTGCLDSGPAARARASAQRGTKPRYSAAFRREVARLLRTGWASVCEMTEATGLSRNTLNRWMREFSDGG